MALSTETGVAPVKAQNKNVQTGTPKGGRFSLVGQLPIVPQGR